jgi:sugar lactone lactonase YvrE
VTSTPDGTAYVTNYATAAIYVVSPSGQASVLVEGDALAPGGINGIDYHPDGYLIAAQVAARGLIRVSLDGSVSTVELPEPIAADGLVFFPDGRLGAVAGTGEGDSAGTEVLVLASDDGWASARIVSRGSAAQDATTAAVRGGDLYVVDARFADMGGDAPSFDIRKAAFE